MANPANAWAGFPNLHNGSAPFPILAASASLTLNDLLQTLQGPNAVAVFAELTLSANQLRSALIQCVELDQKLDKANQELVDAGFAMETATDKHNTEKATLLAVVQASSGGVKRSAPHPDPEPFDGKTPTILPAFLKAMALKLNQNADWYPTTQQRLGYFVSRLSGRAYGQIDANVSADGVVNFDDIPALVTVLHASFGEINEATAAQDKLMKLKQGHRAIADFLPEFTECANLTGIDDVSKIMHLRNALHHTLFVRCTNTPSYMVPTDFLKYCAFIREQDQAQRSFDPNYHKQVKAPSGSYPINPSTPTPPTSTSPTTAQGGDAMDLSAATIVWKGSMGGKRKPRNQKERDARYKYCKEKDLCHWCESPDHAVAECADAPFNKPGYAPRDRKKEN